MYLTEDEYVQSKILLCHLHLDGQNPVSTMLIDQYVLKFLLL